MKVPVESVVNGEFKSGVGADPSPVVPAAKSCTLEPAIGSVPACTVPLKLATT